MLYLIYAESANYCGYGMHFVVEADDEDHAIGRTEGPVEEYFYEQDQSQIEEEHGEDFEGPYGNIIRIEEFGPEHDTWKFYQDPSQAEFYIEVNI
jgi:hypothetical protein